MLDVSAGDDPGVSSIARGREQEIESSSHGNSVSADNAAPLLLGVPTSFLCRQVARLRSGITDTGGEGKEEGLRHSTTEFSCSIIRCLGFEALILTAAGCEWLGL